MSTLAELAVEEILKSTNTTLNYLFPLLFETNILIPAWIYHRVTMWWLKYNKDSIFDKMVESTLHFQEPEHYPKYSGDPLWRRVRIIPFDTTSELLYIWDDVDVKKLPRTTPQIKALFTTSHLTMSFTYPWTLALH